MRQQWYIIDRWGRRSVNLRSDTYWSRFDYGAMDIDWPDFASKSTEWITKWKNEIRGSGAKD